MAQEHSYRIDVRQSHRRIGVALSVELGRSYSTLVLIEGARAYREEVVLRLVVRFRETDREAVRRQCAQLRARDSWLDPI